MQQPKICLIGNSLSVGGAEKIHALLSNYFFSQQIQIYNVVLFDLITYEYSGELLNLGKLEKKNIKLVDIWNEMCVLKKYVKQNKFDYIIDFRSRGRFYKEYLFKKIFQKKPYIITVHSYNTKWYFPQNNFLASKIYNDAFGIVTVSKEIQKKIESQFHYKNVKTIYNPLDLDKIEMLSIEKIDIDFEFVLGVGRMVNDNNKQFDLMIKAYSLSNLPERNIKLVLLGDGEQKKELEKLVLNKNLIGKVVFKGFQDNPFPYFKKAKFTLLTSKFEGLPNTITENLACGTPVISFDCLSGPKELILDRENGLLIENQNFEKLISGMNEMITNKNLYSYCKANAKNSVAKFDIETIGKQWLAFLKIKQN